MIPIKDDIPTDRRPIITYVLLAINVLAYLYSLRQGGSIFGGPSGTPSVRYGQSPYALTHPGSHCELTTVGVVACEGQAGVIGTAGSQPPTGLTALTSMFMHGSLLPLGGNMLFLFIFANNVEASMGRGRVVGFY